MANFKLFKQKEFADDNLIFDENGNKFLKRVENTGNRRNYSLRAISPFPTVFLKDLYYRQIKIRACLGKGLSSLKLYQKKKVWNRPKLKALADDNLLITQKITFDFDRLNNHCANGENDGFQHFLFFKQCF